MRLLAVLLLWGLAILLLTLLGWWGRARWRTKACWSGTACRLCRREFRS